MGLTKSSHLWRLPVYIFYITLLFGTFTFDLISFFGILLATFGTFLYARSRKELGKNYSSKPTIFQTHRLVTTGPYKYVRHPSYVGSFIVMIAFVMISKSFLSLIYALFIALPFGIYKIKIEERMLEKKFGKKFKTYKQKVPMIFPRVGC
jgi:protein-S-isoprenylcysteine O-methyltransferase Ste14